jgi:hypothetical protein
MKLDNWKQLAEKFEAHFPSSEVEIDNKKLLFQDSSSTLEIMPEGNVAAEMPLHSFDTKNVTEIEFDDDSILVKGSEFTYRFRK